MNYTKGPWSFYKNKLRAAFPTVIREIQDSNGIPVIAWAGFDAVEQNGSTKDANANLIAAAPDLYEALKYVASLNTVSGTPFLNLPIINAALLKAEGRS